MLSSLPPAAQALAKLTSSGQMSKLRLPEQLIIVARGDWSRSDDAFDKILEAEGLGSVLLGEQDWTYTWDETHDCDIWIINIPESGS